MEDKEKVTITIDVPEGYEIDVKASNFKTGEIVYKPYEITWEEAVKIWDKTQMGKESFLKTREYYCNHTPSSVAARHEVFVWVCCFRQHQKINREKLKVGQYVIMGGKPVELIDGQRQKGAMVFGSYEEASFVDSMMRKYNNQFSGYTEL